MAALNHKPEEIDEGFPEGIYSIRVKHIECPYVFKSQNEGMRIQFDVWNSDGIGFTNWENIVTSLPRMKWKLKEICYCLGIDFDKENLDSDEFMGKEGKANFTRKPGDKWLAIDHYLSVDSPDIKVDESKDNVPF